MSTYLCERPSVLIPATAQVSASVAAHASVVGLPAVWRALQSLTQQQSVQSIGAPAVDPRVLQLAPGNSTDHGTNGFVAQTTGMAKARKGAEASGIPPRGRPV